MNGNLPRKKSVLSVLLLLAIYLSSSAHGGPILATHVGKTDPKTEGWKLFNATGGSVSGGTEDTPSGTHDYWEVSHPSVYLQGNYYRYFLDSADLDTDWRFSGSIRVVDSKPHYWKWGVPFGLFIVRDDESTWGLFLGNNVIGVLDSSISFSHSFSMNTQDDYHLYDVLFHRNGPGSADDTMDVLVDGNLIFNDVTRSEVQDISSYSGSLRGAWLGSGSSGAYTVMRYGNVALSVIPEPATFTLLSLGLGVLAYRRNRS
ncbi:MAG: PEP-CTERM sorting domain-containing protein [Gammaproteobacteria bacterium]|nr:MAG: PEP-CTERM sorting domain-containing protein [Gammaproteobacteria bacterium]